MVIKKPLTYVYAQYRILHTAIKHPVPDRVKLSFVIFDIWALNTADILTMSATVD